MFASIFYTLIVQPIFNLLAFIYALLPGHNFGLAIIIFTVVVRLLMWPLVKKQLHQAKAMRELQPEIKKIKAQTKGDRQKESAMLMELYKEREISPFGSIGILFVQLVVLIGLYQGLRKVVADPHAFINLAYPFIRHLSWLQVLQHDIHKFDETLFGIVNLTKPAWSKAGIYWPAMVIVVGSAIAQFYQSKQLMPTSKDSRGLRQILKDAGSGKQTEQGEVNAAIGQSTRYFLPIMIFFFTVSIPSALSLYWLVGGITAYIQQARVLGQDETEMEAVADKTSKQQVIEGEVVQTSGKPKSSPGQRKKKHSKATKKRKKK